MCTEGILKGNENGGFVSADETVRKMLPYNQEYVLKEGTYPEKAQEIAAGRAFFDAVGYHDVKVGDTVTLEYRSGMQSEYAPVEFTVSGIYMTGMNIPSRLPMLYSVRRIFIMSVLRRVTGNIISILP